MKFEFIDLFAGIGGMRLAFEELGGSCVFSSEWDKYACQTYDKNFSEKPFGDITKIQSNTIPNFDILLAGFPCQAFSIAGKRMGFNDTRGTLFFEVARVIKDKQPKAFLLENVKGLKNHDKGNTLNTILNVLRNDLGYIVPNPEILNSKNFGVPQNRERIIIVGFRKDYYNNNFKYPKTCELKKSIKNVLEHKLSSTKYYLSQRYFDTLKKHRKRHENKGNGFGYNILSKNDISFAVIIGGMGKERNLIIDKRNLSKKRLNAINSDPKSKKVLNNDRVRVLTPREWARLQGFPNSFSFPVSDTQAYKQLGNSVTINVIKSVGKEILNTIERNKHGEQE